MVQDTNSVCPRIYYACRLCKIRGNQLNRINQQISSKIYECTTLKIISTPQCKAFICDSCKTKIDEHYQFKMQCIRNVNLHRLNTSGINGDSGSSSNSTDDSSGPINVASSEIVECVPGSSKGD
ncbi:uncharacterized protein LOC131436190 [Malaya genurostris]|uniref:uncharacterized protein LOC131436190 n=1 Tax=Malaya genurostris TaxID=325434 RepID=UPI0026F3EF63|nr:uncharacterized protein LOC131436190 [Malaya genurostris]